MPPKDWGKALTQFGKFTKIAFPALEPNGHDQSQGRLSRKILDMPRFECENCLCWSYIRHGLHRLTVSGAFTFTPLSLLPHLLQNALIK
jgi:hypothetical protein